MPDERNTQRPTAIRISGAVDGVRIRDNAFTGNMDALHLEQVDGKGPSNIDFESNLVSLSPHPLVPSEKSKISWIKDLALPVTAGLIVTAVG